MKPLFIYTGPHYSYLLSQEPQGDDAGSVGIINLK